MKNINSKFLVFSILIVSLFTMQSCELVVGIFEAGFWVGIILAAVVVALVIWLFIKILKWLRSK